MRFLAPFSLAPLSLPMRCNIGAFGTGLDVRFLTTVSGTRAAAQGPRDEPRGGYGRPVRGRGSRRASIDWLHGQPYAEWARARQAECPVVASSSEFYGPGTSYQIMRYKDAETVLRDAETFSSSINARAHRPVHGRPHPRDERPRAPHVPQPRGQGVPRVAARTLGRDARAARRSTACSTRSRRSAAPISSRRSRRCTRCR